jgi:hypothetical protein
MKYDKKEIENLTERERRVIDELENERSSIVGDS